MFYAIFFKFIIFFTTSIQLVAHIRGSLPYNHTVKTVAVLIGNYFYLFRQCTSVLIN